MSEGQGSVTYTGRASSGGGGGVVAGARDGLSLDGANFAILGQPLSDVGNPAVMLEDKKIPMADFQLRYVLNEPDPAFVAINHPEGPMFFDWQGSAITGTRWETYWPSNTETDYAPFGDGGQFGNGVALYPGVNEPVTPRPNVVGLLWGYNTEFSMGPIDPAESAFRFATETFFCIGTDPHFEFHMPEITCEPGDSIFRIDSTYVSRSSGIGFRELIINDMTWYDTLHSPATGLSYVGVSYNSGSDQSRITLFSQNTGGTSEILIGNYVDGSANLVWSGGLMFFNAPDQLQLTAPFLAFVATNNICNFAPGTAITDITIVAHDPTAVLDVSSNSKGFFLPRLTTAQRLAINLAGALTGGLMVYDTDIQKVYVSCGNAPTVAWQQVQSV